MSAPALICLAALAFYWSVDPVGSPNRSILAGLVLTYLLIWGVIFFWSDASRIEKAQRFLVTSVSVALTTGFLELLVLTKLVDFRLAFGTPIWEPWRHPDNLLDPKLLHIRKPYYHARFEGIDFRYDGHGLRNDADLQSADVVVIGDSFIEGWKISAADMLTSQLARQLGRTVANLGQSWYGPQQELELLRRYGLQLHPSVCVWVFFEGNDLVEVHRYNDATRDWERFSKQLHSFGERSFTKNAVLAVRRILDAWHPDAASNAWKKWVPAGNFKESDGRAARIYFLDDNGALSARDSQALEVVRSVLGQAYRLCAGEGAKFLFVFIPTKFRVYGKFTTFDADAPPSHLVLSELPTVLDAMVRKQLPGAKFLDLTPALTADARRGSLTYLAGYDSHWSPEGNRVAATAIGQVLEQWR